VENESVMCCLFVCILLNLLRTVLVALHRALFAGSVSIIDLFAVIVTIGNNLLPYSYSRVQLWLWCFDIVRVFLNANELVLVDGARVVRFLTEGRMSMTKSGLACAIVFSCLRCIELCIFLCRLVLFVSTLAD